MATSDALLKLITRNNQPTSSDIINLAPPAAAAVAANPALSPSVLSAIQQSGPVQPGNIVVAPAASGDLASRWDGSTEGGGSTFAETNANAPIYGGGGLRANAAMAGIAQRDRSLAETAKHQQFQEQLGLANLALEQRKAEGAAAAQHLDVISKTQQLTDKAKSDADTAAFMVGLNQIPHDAPDYEAKVGALWAAHSRTNPSVVADTLGLKNTARTRDFEGRKLGGAGAYSGPAKQAFDTNFAQNGDIYQAHAAAKNTQDNEKMVQQAYKDGTLTAEDFSTPGKGALDAQGNVNYQAAQTIANQRQGEATGKPVTAAEKAVQESYRQINILGKIPKEDRTPEQQQFLDIHTRRALQYEQAKDKGAGAAPLPAAPTATTFTTF